MAVPVARDALDHPGLTARRWTNTDAAAQARTGPWAALPTRSRTLGPARRRMRRPMD